MKIVGAGPDLETIERIVQLAARAPSVHNTQPWRWRTDAREPAVVELHAERSRQLHVEDPDGRNLVISCGAALHHAQVAASALGWATYVERVPDGPGSTLLARVQLEPGVVPTDAEATVAAIERRRTDRRRFTSWPVPEERLAHLAGTASEWGVRAVPIVDVTDRFRTELLVHRALARQWSDARTRDEQAVWIDHGLVDGVPSAVLAPADQRDLRRADRFATASDQTGDGDLESSDGLIVLCSGQDGPVAWLRAGEGLSALWLRAAAEGLSVVPLSQVVEVPETRLALQHEVLGGLARPLLLVRVGWQPISRSDLPRTSRRPVGDVLERS
jgi:nitroreductase